MKKNSDGLIERYKTQLVGEEFFKVYRVDYTKTFVSTIRRESVRIFFAIVTMLSLILIQINIIGAYLKSLLK